jgi:hypothetical protein
MTHLDGRALRRSAALQVQRQVRFGLLRNALRNVKGLLQVRLSLMAVVAAIFFSQAYLVRELLTAEAFFVFAFLGVTVTLGAVYLIGSVTMSWWAQGKPDVEEVHAALSEGSIDSRITSNRTLINASSSHDSQPVPLRRPFLSRTHLGSRRIAIAQTAQQTGHFHSQALQRLYRAIVNRAILDALENGEHSPAAQQWLLSRDFDRLEQLLG